MENLSAPSTQSLLARLRDRLTREDSFRRALHEAVQQAAQDEDDQEDSDEEEEEVVEDKEEIEQIKQIEKMLADEEIKRIPRYLIKISNAYFMSAYKYYQIQAKCTTKDGLKVDLKKDDEKIKRIMNTEVVEDIEMP